MGPAPASGGNSQPRLECRGGDPTKDRVGLRPNRAKIFGDSLASGLLDHLGIFEGVIDNVS
jgi:hypothetical protein